VERSVVSRNGERNRTILAAYDAGAPAAALAGLHGLALTTIYSILAMEKHKRSIAESDVPPAKKT
jgi:hypothetical protein